MSPSAAFGAIVSALRDTWAEAMTGEYGHRHRGIGDLRLCGNALRRQSSGRIEAYAERREISASTRAETPQTQ